MTTSTTRDKNTRLSPALRLGAVAVWLLLWQLASMAVGLPLLLPSPLAVLLRLGQLCTGLLAERWAAGQDLLGLGAYQALQTGAALDPTKNACPPLRTDVAIY